VDQEFVEGDVYFTDGGGGVACGLAHCADQGEEFLAGCLVVAGDDPAAKDYGQVSHIALAGLVMLLIVVITRCFRGFISQIAVLLSIAIGTLVAWPMGLLDFSSTHSAAWVGFSGFFRFGHPKFEAAAIISMCIVMLVTYTESTADMLAVAEMVDKKLTQNDLARGLATDALSAVLAGFLNSFPDTAFAENVGLVGLTRVRSRSTSAARGSDRNASACWSTRAAMPGSP
jgi:NCS2 family nucleobase:cation symporter-2